MTTTAIIVSLANRNYHYDQGVYYVKVDNGYKAVAAPIGANIPELPEDTQDVVVDSKTSYYYMGTFYKEDSGGGYTVIKAPVGGMVSYLPDGYTTQTSNGKTYYVYAGVYYQAKAVDSGTAYVVTKATDPAS